MIGLGINIWQSSGTYGSTAPVPSLLSPASGDTFEDGDTVLLHAIFASTAGLTSVEFYDGATLLGTASAAPWEYQWTGVVQGAHSVKARAKGTGLADNDSPAVSITVNAPLTAPNIAGNNIKAYYDQATPANVTLNAGRVQTVANGAGTALLSDATQGTAGTRPLIDKIRGRDALFFDGSATHNLVGTYAGTQTQRWDMLCVVRPTQRAAASVIAAWSAAGSAQCTSATYPRNLLGNANSSLTATGAQAASTTHLFCMQAAGLSGVVRIDSASAATGTIGSAAPVATNTMFVGSSTAGSSKFVGCIGGFTIASVSDDTKRGVIESYLSSYYHVGQTGKKIMFIGDSITVGQGSTDGDGWRRLLWSVWHSKHKVSGSWLEAIGPVEDGGYADDCHYGQSGKDIQYIRTNLVSIIGSGTEFPSCDVVCLMIGTNNARGLLNAYVTGDYNVGGSTQEQLYLLLGELRTKFGAGCKIVVTKCVDISIAGDATSHANIVDFNSRLETTWAAFELANSTTLYRWDANAALGTWGAGNFSDTYHPNDTGYALLAAEIKPAIVRAAA